LVRLNNEEEIDMKKDSNNTNKFNGKIIKSYTAEEQNQFINNLAQALRSSKNNDKDNEDM
jgi:hypothetical protein